MVTVTYPNAAHNRTETFDFENEADKLFMELFDERADEDKQYIGLYMIEINTEKNQVWMKKTWKRPTD
jgi:hypothetical protein